MGQNMTRIVIIDDEEDLCFLLGNILSAQGYEVKSFYTLKDGLEGVAAFQPDWVIIDNDLPDGRGWEETETILALRPGIGIIKISANPDSERTHTRDGIYYLIKPIHVNSITELIKHDLLKK